MIKYAVFAMLALAAAPLAAQSTAAPADTKPTAAAPAAKPRLTIDSTLEEIAANPKGKEALNAIFPGFTESEFYDGVKSMTLRNFEISADGFVSSEQIQKVEAALAQL